MRTRKKKENYRKRVRYAREIIKTAPEFKSDPMIFDYKQDCKDGYEARLWVASLPDNNPRKKKVNKKPIHFSVSKIINENKEKTRLYEMRKKHFESMS